MFVLSGFGTDFIGLGRNACQVILKEDFPYFRVGNVHSDILNKIVLVPVVPSKLKDYQLNNYYRILENTDIDSLDLVHFGLVKNEMIKRGFLQENITNLNDYKASYLFDNRRASAHVPMTFIPLDMPCYVVPFILQQNLF